MPRGGPRPGSGRPRKEVIYSSPIRDAEGKIRDRLPWIVDRLFELAEGVHVAEATRDGAVVYQRPPDRQACEYLLDRIMGKPTQPIDLREQAARIAAELGIDVAEVLAEAERIATGRH